MTMQTFTFEQATQAQQLHTEMSKSVSGANSKVNQLRDKFHNDVDVVQRSRVSVPKGASVGGFGKLKAPTVIVLNRTLSEINIMPEHGFYFPNAPKNKYRYEPCLDFAKSKLPETTCPICKAAQQNLHNAKFPYMRMALTVLMERINESGQTVAWDKKLLVVKNDNFKTFNNLLVTGERVNNGNIRGMAFVLERGTGEKSLSSGAPSVNPDNSFAFSFVGEDWLAQVQAVYQPTEVRSDDKKYLYKPAGWLTTPININQNLDILNYSTEDELRKEFDPSYVHNLQATTVPTQGYIAPAVQPGLVPPPVISQTAQVQQNPLQSVVAPPVVTQPAMPVHTQTLPPVPPVPQVAYAAPATQPVQPPQLAMPALAQQRNLQPVMPPVGVGNVDEVDAPWENEE